MIISWVGIALTAIGIMFNGYKFMKENPEVIPKMPHVQLLKRHEAQPIQKKFMYSQVNVAYDVETGKHWFQHPDSQWREFPPKPSQVDMLSNR